MALNLPEPLAFLINLKNSLLSNIEKIAEKSPPQIQPFVYTTIIFVLSSILSIVFSAIFSCIGFTNEAESCRNIVIVVSAGYIIFIISLGGEKSNKVDKT